MPDRFRAAAAGPGNREASFAGSTGAHRGRGAASRGVPLVVRASPATRWLPVAAVVIVAVLLVGPALLDPGNRVAGEQGDPAAAVWQLHEMGAGRLGLIDPTTTSSANAPSGAYLRRPIEVSTAAFDVVALGAVRVFGAVVAYNLLLVLAVVANGLAMLFLARRIGLGTVAATLSALAFAAAPPLLIELQLHVALAFAFTIPLVAAFGAQLLERPALRSAVVAGAITGFAVYVNPYLPLYTATVLAAFLVAVLVRHHARGLSAVLVAGGTAAAIALPAVVVVVANHASVVAETHRTIEEVDLFALSAGDYLRAFGEWWVALPVVIVVVLGFRPLRALTPAWGALLASGAVGFVLTLASRLTVAGFTVRMPSRLLFELFPIWRVIGRASVLVWFVVALFLGAACSRVDARQGWKLAPLALAAIVVLAAVAWADGAHWRGQPWFPVNTDPQLTALFARTRGRVAEYPLWGFDNAIGPYLARQTLHGRQLLNGGIPNTLSADLASVAGDAGDPQAAMALAVAGVTRIAAHGGAPVPDGTVPVVRTRDGAEVYDVLRSDRPAVAVLSGAYAREQQAGGRSFRWVGDQGRFEVISAEPGRYTLRFVASAAGAAPRELRIGDTALGTLTSTPQVFTVCVDTHATDEGLGVSRTRLGTAEGPVRLGVGDPRRASLAVWSESVTPGCGEGIRSASSMTATELWTGRTILDG